MKSVSRVMITLFVGSLLLSIVAQLNAQGKPQSTDAPQDQQVPPSALLTERGRQLAEELRMLKRSRASLGAKHPTLPTINEKIEGVLEQLKAWQPAPNPFRPGEQPPQMNEIDFRQMVIKLTKKVEDLEKRVEILEGTSK